MNVDPNAVPTILENLKPFHSTVVARLNELSHQELTNSQRWRLSLGLLADDEGQLAFLRDYVLDASPSEVSVIRDALHDYRDSVIGPLWTALKDTGKNPDQKLRAACMLAQFDSTNTQWQQIKGDVVTSFVSVAPTESKSWIVLLRPVSTKLVEPLQARYRDRSPARDIERPLAAAALANYLKDQPKKLTELILLADNDREFLPFLEALRSHRTAAVDEFRRFVSQVPPPDVKPDVRDTFWRTQANAAACLLSLDEREAVWPLLKHSENPSLRSFIIERLARLGADYRPLADRLYQETEPSTRQALILALGEFDALKMSEQERQGLVEMFAGLYRTDPDPGVHSAAGWTLKQYQAADTVACLDAELRKASTQDNAKKRHWFINSQGQTFVVVDGPVDFLMGDEPNTEGLKKATIAYRFAVATHEMTVKQFQRFRKDYKPSAGSAAQPDFPADSVSWFDAAAYCNWLSQEEGIPKEQWCYERNEKDEYGAGMKIPVDSVKRTGYRLPTAAEWECVCRANTRTSFSCGEQEELLGRYAWYVDNSRSHTWPVGRLKPNALGVFDMHGNVWEWCQDRGEQKAERSSDGSETVGSNSYRVLCGGAFNSGPSLVRSANRILRDSPGDRILVDLRPARTYP